MMKDRKEFEEFEMKLIWLENDIICTSVPDGHSGSITDPNDDPVNPGPGDGPEIFD